MDEGVSTSMDQLVELLEKKDTIKVSDAAKELGTDKEHIESWTRMLEKAGLVELHYSVIGGAFVKRGPKFDTLLTGGGKEGIQGLGLRAEETKAAPAAGVTAPAVKAQVPQKPAGEAKAVAMTTTATPAVGKPEPAKQEKPIDTSMKYLLIRKRIEDEEAIVQENMRKLQDEEQKVMEYMNLLIAEGKKLTEYIETLRQILEELKKGEQGVAPTASANKSNGQTKGRTKSAVTRKKNSSRG